MLFHKISSSCVKCGYDLTEYNKDKSLQQESGGKNQKNNPGREQKEKKKRERNGSKNIFSCIH